VPGATASSLLAVDGAGDLISGPPTLSAVIDSSLVDLCRGPYNCQPGTDITATLQQAVNDKVVPGAAIEFYFSQPGTYQISGAVQSGAAGGTNYAGQILLPAIPWGGAAASVKFRGCVAPPHYYSQGPGVILQSNAASGNVFSVIGNATGSYPGWSNIWVSGENITVTLPTNPQCGGLDMTNAWGGIFDQVRVAGGSSTAAALTGSGVGINFTHGVIGAGPVFRNCAVNYLPFGIGLTDHCMLLGDNFFTSCGAALTGANAAPAYLNRVYAMGCLAVIQPTGTLKVEGSIAFEATGAVAAQLINDPNGQLQGHVRVFMSGDSPSKHKSLGAICGNSSTGTAIELADTLGAGGYKDNHPADTFLRVLPAPTAAGVPGLCSETLHPWRVQAGSFALTQGANNGSLTHGGAVTCQALVPVKRALQGGESRAITAAVTTVASTDAYVYANFVNGAGHQIAARIWDFFGTAQLIINGTTVGSVQSIFTTHTTYTVTLALSVNSAGQPVRARMFVNGSKLIDYGLTAAQQAAFAPVQYPWVEDGLGFASDDGGTTFTGFTVRPLNDDPFVGSGTATLVGGTTSPALTLTTASTTAVTAISPALPVGAQYAVTSAAAGIAANTIMTVTGTGTTGTLATAATASTSGAAATTVFSNPNITANSKVRVFNDSPAGTVGALSVAMTAGVGFTINSTSGADTSTIYYEIVSY
jgi:hypothetical protein